MATNQIEINGASGLGWVYEGEGTIHKVYPKTILIDLININKQINN